MKSKKFMSLLLALSLTLSSVGFASAGEVATNDVAANTVTTANTSSIKTVVPVIKASSYSYNKIKITWNAVSGASGYEVYRATSKTGKYTKVYTAAAGKTSYINSGLTCGKTYYYKLRAYQVKSGKKTYSKYSEIASTYATLSKVMNAKVEYDYSTSFDITWDEVSGASGYQLQVKPASTGKWSTYYRSNNNWDEKYYNYYPETTSWKESKYITKGTEAYWQIDNSEESMSFRVRAYKTVNGKKVFGSYSEPTEIEQVWKTGKELSDFVEDWVDENYPTYDKADNETMRSWVYPEREGVNWGTTWTYYTISKYMSKEDVLKYLCEMTLKDYYFAVWWGYAEDTHGILYTRDLGNGDYQIWWIN